MKRKLLADNGASGHPASNGLGGGGGNGGNGGAVEKNPFFRNVEHIEGNWASTVYLTANYSRLSRISEVCNNHVVSTALNDLISGGNSSSRSIADRLIKETKPHVSLSKPFYLRKHQIERFISLLGEALSLSRRFTAVVRSEYHLLLNESETRLFVSLPVEENRVGALRGLVSLVDSVLATFHQPTYYENPLFHVSISSMALRSTNVMRLSNGFLSNSGDGNGNIDSLLINRVRHINQNKSAHPQVTTVYAACPDSNYEEEDEEDDDDDVAMLVATRRDHQPQNNPYGHTAKQSAAAAFTEHSRAKVSGGVAKELSSSVLSTLAGYSSSSSSSSSGCSDDDDDNDDNGDIDGDHYNKRKKENVKGQPSRISKGGIESDHTVTTHNEKHEGTCLATSILFIGIECKIGNRIFHLPLLENTSSLNAKDTSNNSDSSVITQSRTPMLQRGFKEIT